MQPKLDATIIEGTVGGMLFILSGINSFVAIVLNFSGPGPDMRLFVQIGRKNHFVRGEFVARMNGAPAMLSVSEFLLLNTYNTFSVVIFEFIYIHIYIYLYQKTCLRVSKAISH